MHPFFCTSPLIVYIKMSFLSCFKNRSVCNKFHFCLADIRTTGTEILHAQIYDGFLSVLCTCLHSYMEHNNSSTSMYIFDMLLQYQFWFLIYKVATVPHPHISSFLQQKTCVLQTFFLSLTIYHIWYIHTFHWMNPSSMLIKMFLLKSPKSA